jgi:hypothetical protein
MSTNGSEESVTLILKFTLSAAMTEQPSTAMNNCGYTKNMNYYRRHLDPRVVKMGIQRKSQSKLHDLLTSTSVIEFNERIYDEHEVG